MITRQAWRDAVRASGLPASRRAVLLDMADWWHQATTRPVFWVSQKEIAERTGLSEATVKRAWRDAEVAGLLVLVERHRQHRSPRWAPVLPPVQTGHPDRSDSSQSGHPDRSETTGEASRPVTVHSRPVTVTADTKDPKATTTTSTGRSAPVQAGLAMVVVAELPNDLARSIRRRVLAEALVPAAAAGWTPAQLASAARHHGWLNASPGAVIAWARDLDQPPKADAVRRPLPGPAVQAVDGVQVSPGDLREAYQRQLRAVRDQRAGTG